MWRIFVPLTYLFIDHPEKRKFDFLLPLVFTVLFSAPILSQDFRNDAVTQLGLIEKFTNFLGVLTGFFIAALAAVATFNKLEMDDPMPGEPPVRLEHRVNRETYFENLSRRRFLSFLFGYLALITLLLYITSFAYVVADKFLFAKYWPDYRGEIFSVFWVLYMFAISNVLSNTLLGLFYLTDRIHRSNRALARNEPPSSDPAASKPPDDEKRSGRTTKPRAGR